MNCWLIGGAVIFVLWVLATMKTSRPDGEYLHATHKFRKMMPYLMRGRNESVVYFDSYVNAEPLLDYLKNDVPEDWHVDLTHAVVAATAIGMHENPSMNRFVVGRRLYQRKGVHVTFSMKRKKLDRDAKVVISKVESFENDTFETFAKRMGGNIVIERSDKKTYVDKELDIFLLLPRPLLNMMTGLVRTLDYYNLLPKMFIDGDAMYTSIVVANLGSLNMSAGYHHLYEWGTSPLFLMVGKIEEKPVVENGEIVIRKMLHLRYSYDERIDDGLNARFGIDSVARVLAEPKKYLGCVAEDGSDRRPFLAPGQGN